MYKGLLLLTGFLCACNIMIKAQYEGTTDTVQYTMDKLIPSYLQIKDKGISSPRTTALKARHAGLERLLNLCDRNLVPVTFGIQPTARQPFSLQGGRRACMWLGLPLAMRC